MRKWLDQFNLQRFHAFLFFPLPDGRSAPCAGLLSHRSKVRAIRLTKKDAMARLGLLPEAVCVECHRSRPLTPAGLASLSGRVALELDPAMADKSENPMRQILT